MAGAAILGTLIAMPKSMFLPIFLFVFGLTRSEQVALSLVESAPVIIVGVAAASFAVDDGVRVFVRSLDMNRASFFWKIYLPAAAPQIIESMRIGVIVALSGLLTVEMYGSFAHIGTLTVEYSTQVNLAGLFAIVILVSVIAIVINSLLLQLEVRLSRWRGAE
jgi:ABC-type nitrate/sulfonate/bicarbonate transport system permease component